jgi:ribonucleotide monophosphatase NagD (HAD superfamily)
MRLGLAKQEMESFANASFQAFKILMKTNGELFSLGKGKFYREDGDLTLDVGPFTAALEFATDREALVVGKPNPAFFMAALVSIFFNFFFSSSTL